MPKIVFARIPFLAFCLVILHSGSYSQIVLRGTPFPKKGEIILPPLRERKEDIQTLATHFVSRFSKQAGEAHKNIKQ